MEVLFTAAEVLWTLKLGFVDGCMVLAFGFLKQERKYSQDEVVLKSSLVVPQSQEQSNFRPMDDFMLDVFVRVHRPSLGPIMLATVGAPGVTCFAISDNALASTLSCGIAPGGLPPGHSHTELN